MRPNNGQLDRGPCLLGCAVGLLGHCHAHNCSRGLVGRRGIRLCYGVVGTSLSLPLLKGHGESCLLWSCLRSSHAFNGLCIWESTVQSHGVPLDHHCSQIGGNGGLYGGGFK